MEMHNVLALILGGGHGARLYPLTKMRSKPAVPLAGKYRLIDIPLSNCLHAGIDKIAILTQFNSVSLHRHIQRAYGRDMFAHGWVDILAAQQTSSGQAWYQGTADAIRQQIHEIRSAKTEFVLVLPGDHLYQMDYQDFLRYHLETDADITLAVQPTERRLAPGLGILKCDSEGRIVVYKEKPKLEELDGLESLPDQGKPFMASMGIYLIRTSLLAELLASPGNDLAKDITPTTILKYRVMGYAFRNYWADIGTIRRYYEVNLELVSKNSPFDFNNPLRPIYTHARFLPPCEVYGAKLKDVILTDGGRIYDAEMTRSVIGLRSIIRSNVTIHSSIIMGADYYESGAELAQRNTPDAPSIGIGEGTIIESALIDKNARIGRHVHIRHLPSRPDSETDSWVARDGLVIILKNAVIPDGTII